MATIEIKITPEDIEQASAGAKRTTQPVIMVIFGASGDLTKRKLLPALFRLDQSGFLPEAFEIVGVARRFLGKSFASDMKDGILQYGGVNADDPKLEVFLEKIHYFAMNFDDSADYDGLKRKLESLDKEKGTAGNRLFYLATAPEYFTEIVSQIGRHGMAKPEKGIVRTIVEKPFGHDLESARELNNHINSVFDESQVFRIDHYLGKETVQNIMVFRFANGMFEPVWNQNYIDHVQITAAEDIGVESRGPFYEKAGAMRDVVQNHVMELLSFVAMEPPSSFEAESVRREKLKVWKAIPSIPILNVVRGQYGPGTVNGEQVKGYRQEDRVAPDSQTETFAAVKLQLDNWRWAGVPFYLRAGKRLAKRTTEISIQFKQPPQLIFNRASSGPCRDIQPNVITMRIQPDEGISLRFGAKVPGLDTSVCPVTMDFSYAGAFGKSSSNGYERPLLDATLGDQTLFAHRDAVETAWALYTPLLEVWGNKKTETFPNYSAGSGGPYCGDALLAKDGRKWRRL
jgi:glucose-6-phosphate 1-dehydrogenase